MVICFMRFTKENKMELISAIVLLCGLNLGNAQVGHTSIRKIMDKTQKCQIQLAKCMSKTSFRSESDLLNCIGKRK